MESFMQLQSFWRESSPRRQLLSPTEEAKGLPK
jgi:hypothetical protein